MFEQITNEWINYNIFDLNIYANQYFDPMFVCLLTLSASLIYYHHHN